jgi:hypothetical protein
MRLGNAFQGIYDNLRYAFSQQFVKCPSFVQVIFHNIVKHSRHFFFIGVHVRHEAKRMKNVGVAAFVYVVQMRLSCNGNGFGEWVHISSTNLSLFSKYSAYPKVAKVHTVSLHPPNNVDLTP